jgi:eukaryotic-like serine/threonine-protein kinase
MLDELTTPGSAVKICRHCLERFIDQPRCSEHEGDLLPLGDLAESPRIGTLVADRFLVLELIGRGGMGTVFRAWQRSTDRAIALKLLSGSNVTDREYIERFTREARTTARLTSPHTVVVHDFGELQDGELFIAMELLAGRSLDRVLDEEGPLDPSRVERIVDQICRSLGEAHAQGLVHRDIKPSNVMLIDIATPNERVKVLDFGLVKVMSGAQTITQSGTICGTPPYMAPELWSDEYGEIGPATDFYALGAMIFELLTGERAFVAKSVPSTMLKHLHGTAPSLPEHPSFDAIVRRCLEKRSEDRYASAAEIQRAIGIAPTSQPARPIASIAAPALAPAIDPRVYVSAPFTVPGPRRWPAYVGPSVAAIAIAIALFMKPTETPQKIETKPLPQYGGALPSAGKPPAIAAYAAGMQAYHDAYYNLAVEKLEEAVTLDPSLGSAHLRLGYWLVFGNPESAREHRRAALHLRSTLDDRERLLLDATSPCVQSQPFDFIECRRRAEALTARFPNDTELLMFEAMVAQTLGDMGAAERLYTRVLGLDPSFSLALDFRGFVRSYLGQDGLPDIDACLARSSGSGSCRLDRSHLLSHLGRCSEMEENARLWAAANPGDGEPYAHLAEALLAQGRSMEAVRLAIEQKRSKRTPAQNVLAVRAGRVLDLFDEVSLDVLSGNFGAAERHAKEMAEAAEPDPTVVPHAHAVRRLVEIYRETQRTDQAALIATAFLEKKDGWLAEPMNDDWAISRDLTPMLLAVRRSAGIISRSLLEAERDAWLAEWTKRDVELFRPWLWLQAYAAIAETPEEAREALAVLPEYGLAPFAPGTLDYADLGNVYLLAGDLDRAIEHLSRAVRACHGIAYPFKHTVASFHLGQALEAKGDKAGACVAYTIVARRWSKTKPPAITWLKAQERMRALRCE